MLLGPSTAEILRWALARQVSANHVVLIWKGLVHLLLCKGGVPLWLGLQILATLSNAQQMGIITIPVCNLCNAQNLQTRARQSDSTSKARR